MSVFLLLFFGSFVDMDGPWDVGMPLGLISMMLSFS